MSWMDGLKVDHDDCGSEEFQTRECRCINCTTEGLFELHHNHTPVECRWASEYSREYAKTCKLCIAAAAS